MKYKHTVVAIGLAVGAPCFGNLVTLPTGVGDPQGYAPFDPPVTITDLISADTQALGDINSNGTLVYYQFAGMWVAAPVRTAFTIEELPEIYQQTQLDYVPPPTPTPSPSPIPEPRYGYLALVLGFVGVGWVTLLRWVGRGL